MDFKDSISIKKKWRIRFKNFIGNSYKTLSRSRIFTKEETRLVSLRISEARIIKGNSLRGL